MIKSEHEIVMDKLDELKKDIEKISDLQVAEKWERILKDQPPHDPCLCSRPCYMNCWGCPNKIKSEWGYYSNPNWNYTYSYFPDMTNWDNSLDTLLGGMTCV